MPGSVGPEVLGLKSSQRGQGLTLASQKSPVVSRGPAGVWGLECLLRSHTWGTDSKRAFFYPPWKDRQPGDTGRQRPRTLRHPSGFADTTDPSPRLPCPPWTVRIRLQSQNQPTFKFEFFNPFDLIHSYIHVLMYYWQADLRMAPRPMRGFSSWNLDPCFPSHAESSLTSPTPTSQDPVGKLRSACLPQPTTQARLNFVSFVSLRDLVGQLWLASVMHLFF